MSYLMCSVRLFSVLFPINNMTSYIPSTYSVQGNLYFVIISCEKGCAMQIWTLFGKLWQSMILERRKRRMMQNSFLHHPSFLGFFVQLLFDLLDPQKSTKTYIGSIRSAYFLHKLCLECWNFDRKKYVNLPPWELPGIHFISCRS